MLESSPGYALFTDLRKKMGMTSSQPIPSPSRVANTSMVASPATKRKAHFNPNMDDVAASQQLMDEEDTRAAADGTNRENMTLSQVNGSHDPSSSKQKKRKRKGAHKSGQNSIALSPAATQDLLAQRDDSPFPFPASQPEPELSTTNGLMRSTAIEVPDSQVPAQSLHTSAASPTGNHVIPSSNIVPSSATKSKRTYKTSKRTKRDRLSRDNIQEDDFDHDRDISMLLEKALSPSRAPSKHRPSQGDDAESGSHMESKDTPDLEGGHSRKVATEPVNGTPTPKRRKIGSAKSATRVRDLIQDGPHDGNDEDGDLLRSTEKTKLKRIKKPRTPIAKSKNIYEIPDDDPRPTNGHGENGDAQDKDAINAGVADAMNSPAQPGGAGQLNTPKVASTRKPRSSLKKARKTNDEAHNSATAVRTPGQPLGDDDDEDTIMREPISSDEDDYRDPPPDTSSRDEFEKKERKKKRKSTTKKATPRRESGKFSYKRKNVQTGTAAERALAGVDHTVNYPPDLRTTGDFTADEEELIRRAVRDYQDRKELEIPQLVRIIQWSKQDPALNRTNGEVSGKNDWTPQDMDNARESAEFWNDIKNITTKRSFDRMRRHIRQTYHMFKSGAWTDEEDQLLRDLYSQHPNKWKVIEVGMGDRSMHDCQNRWRDYLQYGDKLKSSRWEPEEEELFIHAITTVAQRDEDYRAEQGLPPVDEYTIKHINWQQVSREMDNTRSRIQVVAKWKNLQKRNPPPHIQVEHKPRKNKSALSGLTASDPTPRKRGRPQQGEGQIPRGHHVIKSQMFIHTSDDDEVHDAPPSEERGRPSLGESSVVKKSMNFRTTEPDDIVDDSDEDEQANRETNASPTKKKRRKSGKSQGMEREKPQKSKKSKIRDEIEDPDDEDINVDQNATRSSPPSKKRGRIRKNGNTESEEPKKRRKSKAATESVEDLELREEEQSEQVGGNGNDVEENTTSASSIRPNNVPNQRLDDGHEGPRDIDEDEDPIEDEDDQPRAASDSPAKDVDAEQSEADSGDAVSQKDDEELDEEEKQLDVTHNGSAENLDDDQSEADSDATSQKENEEHSGEEVDQASISPRSPAADVNDNQPDANGDATPPQKQDETPPLDEEKSQSSPPPTINPGSSKPTVSDSSKMQWGDLYDLIARLQERRDEEEGDIDWEGVAEEMSTEDRNYIWSEETLRTAFEDMVQLIRDNGKEVDTEDLPGTVDDIMDFVSGEHGGEIEEYYSLE
ncbi:hypothetical protein AA0117_g6340 [Alternaria alternata]|uniref:DNA-binding protein REB1 n=1 Tax=Alternaria alternata TaxID=5599 RepID=A0A4Q4NHW2_ALTAL|nr:hypothetical protein AA0117_g6340 [Alternaria alternata]